MNCRLTRWIGLPVLSLLAAIALPAQENPAKRLASIVGVATEEYAKAIDEQGKLVFGPSSLPPDVLAQLAGSTVHISFTPPGGGDSWPDRLPFRLLVAERTASTTN